MLLDAGLVQCNLITRPSEKLEGGSGREAGVEVYRAECIEFVIINSYPARLESIMLSIIIMGIIASQKHLSIMPE